MSLNNIGSPAAGAPPAAQALQNYTLDDASPILTYQGFTQNQQGETGPFERVNLYDQSVSYTTAAQASASFQFKGVALYVYGVCGPEMGAFTVTVDSKPPIALSAATTSRHYDQLLFSQTQLDDQQTHTVIVTNQNNGKMLALDYFILTSDGSKPTEALPQPTSTPLTGEPGPDSTGAVIGGIIGGLVALLLLIIWYRYRRYRAAGGKGDCQEIFLGIKPRPKPVEPPKPTPWTNWPMLSFKPKYDDP